MTSHALRLTAADFDACRSERRASRVAVRRRVDLGQRALAWGRALATRLAALDLDVEVDAPAARTAADPSAPVLEPRWVVLHREKRDEAPRGRRRGPAAPHKRHAFLGLAIDEERVAVSCELFGGAEQELAQLRARLADPRRAAELIAAIAALPDQFEFGTTTGPRVPCAHVTRELLRRALDDAQATAGLWIGWSVPREVALLHATLLDEQLGDALVALAPVWRLVSGAAERRDAGTVFEKGAKVRVLSGPFASKVGTVSELDGRGGARVMLGLLSTRVDLDDLGPVVEPRFSLHSSHRRIPARARS